MKNDNKNESMKEMVPPEKFGIGVTHSGRLSWDIDDQTARDLRGKSTEEIIDYVSQGLFELGYESLSPLFRMHYAQYFKVWTVPKIKVFLTKRYQRFNKGLQRVYLGTLLRKARNRKENGVNRSIFKRKKEK